MNPLPQASADAGSSHITIGALVAGRYRVTARVGAGGMATIYRARDESLERDVAIKVLHAHLADDDSLLARFRAEARSAAGLLHPNIVNVFDQGVADLPYIVMEYVDGPSLRDVLLQQGRLAPGQVLAVAEPVCRALARAHQAGVVHRDVKPENVLIAADGTPKVADFGIARAVAETSHTATGTLVGSVHYLAPELMGGAEATASSDQYSLGVVLFELLTGRKPLPAETPMAVAMRHARERVPSVRDFVSDAPPALDRVIRQATAQEPGRRYPDLSALAAALRDSIADGPEPVIVDAQGAHGGETVVIAVDAEPTVAVDTTAAPAGRRGRVRRSRRRWPFVVVALLVALAAGGLATWNWVVAPVTPVPDLVGLPVEAAEAAATEVGLDVVVDGEVHELDVAEGHVVSQEPADTQTLRRGEVVAVVVSLGPAEVTLPDVTGKAGRNAIEQLRSAPLHLEVRTVDVFSDTVPRGRVVAQRPKPQRTVLQGSTVTVRISQGVEQVTVPDVVGKDKDRAAADLDEAKLRYSVTEQYSDDVPRAGTVIAQSLKAGATVDKGTTVALTVSKGPQTVSVDDYLGQPLERARSALRALGLQVRVEEQARPLVGPTRQGSYGRVEAQVPGAGTRVKRGETITLYTFSAAAEEEGSD